MGNIVEDTLGRPTVFLDQEKVTTDYVPEELVGRDGDMARLAQHFRGVFEGSSAQQVTIRGPVGTGKTALAKRFAFDLREAMRKKGRTLDVAYVNCRNQRTDTTALTKVVQHLDKGFPERGFKFDEVLDAIGRLLEKRDAHLVVLLDEIDVLIKIARHEPERTNLLYALSRFNQGLSRARLSVLAVGQTDFFGDLDEATASSFPRANVVQLERYTQPELRAIVDQRVRLAFKPGRVSSDVAELVSDIAAVEGDARRAIQVLRLAGTRADEDDSEEVMAEAVREAAATFLSALPPEKLRELPLHEVLTLLAVARRLNRTQDAYAITGDVEKVYHLVSEEAEEAPRKHTQFWSYLKNLDKIGFIQLKPSGKGQAGTTQLISLPDQKAATFEAHLVQILGQVHQKAF